MTEFRISSTCQPRRTVHKNKTPRFQATTTACTDTRQLTKAPYTERVDAQASARVGIEGAALVEQADFFFRFVVRGPRRNERCFPELSGDIERRGDDPPQAFRLGDNEKWLAGPF